MRRTTVAIIVAIAVALVIALAWWNLGRTRPPDLSTSRYAQPRANKLVPAAAASPADDGNWTMPGKDYASTRFSALTELNPGNVGKLQVAFTF